MLIDYTLGQSSVVLRVKIRASATGNGLTGLTNTTSGLIIAAIADVEATTTAYAAAASHVQTIATLGTFAAPSASSCRFAAVDGTNHPGLYELQLDNTRYAVSSAKSLTVTISGATGMLDCDVVVPLRSINPYDGVHGGMSALPNTACTTNASLLTSGAGTDQISVTAGSVTLGGYASGQDPATLVLGATQSSWVTAGTIGASLATSSSYGVAKNQDLDGFEFYMALTGDHYSPAAGASITATRSLDGGSFGACANPAIEVGNGLYKIDLAASDLNGNTVGLSFAASGCDTTLFTIVTNS